MREAFWGIWICDLKQMCSNKSRNNHNLTTAAIEVQHSRRYRNLFTSYLWSAREKELWRRTLFTYGKMKSERKTLGGCWVDESNEQRQRPKIATDFKIPYLCFWRNTVPIFENTGCSFLLVMQNLREYDAYVYRLCQYAQGYKMTIPESTCVCGKKITSLS